MAQQAEEGGWPLGLQPLNLRSRNHALSGSVSFSNFLSCSPSTSSHASSDLDSASTGSFFHDRSVTLGNLMGVSTILELSRRSIRRGKTLSETLSLRTKPRSNPKSKSRCFGFCLCPRDKIDVLDASRNNIVPLGHFLEVERRAAEDHRRSGQHNPLLYGADELTLAQPFEESSNSLFVGGQILPPTTLSQLSGSNSSGRREVRGFRGSCF